MLRWRMIHAGVKLLVKAVITGFGLGLGGAVFKKVQNRIGLGERDKKADAEAETVARGDGATDPELQQATC
jgi:hypothetical protein